jgi:hypothetical protein
VIGLRSSRYTLVACLAIAALAGCGGHTGGGVLPNNAAPNSFPYHKTFYYTGGAQNFKVPAGVKRVSVVALGARGAGSAEGLGGRVHAIIPVNPGETLLVYVGGNASGTTGGFNGGANGGQGWPTSDASYGYGGGGAADVRQGGDGLANRVIVVGGGGGQGGGDKYTIGGAPGKGGGTKGGAGGSGILTTGFTGQNCSGSGGAGGTQSTGGGGGSGGFCVEFGGNTGARIGTWTAYAALISTGTLLEASSLFRFVRSPERHIR